MRLTAHVHVVGSGAGGLSMTAEHDCHVYLLDGGAEAALVDAGIGSATDAVLDNVAAAGVDPDRVRHLFLTHAHPDHAGGAAALAARLSGLRVWASPQAARWVRAGDEDAMCVEAGKRADFYPRDFSFVPCDVEAELVEGDSVSVGDLEVRVVETPGHCEGHVSLLARDGGRLVAFAGDLVFSGGLVSLANNWDCRIQDYAASVRKLDGAGIDVLLPGHHGLTLSDGQRHVDAANRLFAAGFVPRSVV